MMRDLDEIRESRNEVSWEDGTDSTDCTKFLADSGSSKLDHVTETGRAATATVSSVYAARVLQILRD